MAKTASAPAPQDPPAAADASPKKKRGKKAVVVAAALGTLVAGGGAAGWYFLGAAHEADAEASAPAAPVKKAPPVFHNLELFTVNLQDADGDRYVQLGVVVELAGNDALEAVKAHMPIIRNDVLMLLSSKKASELATPRGKETLAREIAAAARRPLPAAAQPRAKPAGDAGETTDAAAPEDRRGIEGVYFSTFIIQ